ncbi:MAG: YidC/Oxa1 family membrane protein insertase [Microthrixaceae bacterium]|nr:YidC/Oxa1 family membrane protein insertase [Microthrixaceae bacterium]
MFEPLFDALASVMNFFYTLIPNYGFAIMGLTVVVMLVITPLTVKSTRSMLEMQRLQPEMKRIQEKYKNDREKLNAELMAFYKEHKINPLGGCLPLIAQMPVFIIMYQLMRGLTVRAGGLGTGIGHIGGQSMTGAGLTPWVMTDQVFQPSHLNPDSAMYVALSHTSDMNFLGMDLSLSASEALQMGVLIAIPFLALLGIMLVTGIVQNRQLQARNANASANPQQQMIMKFMPFFLPVISFGFPAGLALYWTTQNLCRIGTNKYITHSIYAKHREENPIEARSTEKSKADKAVPAKSKGSSAKAKANEKAKEKANEKAKANKKDKGNKSASNGASSERGPGKSVKSQKAHEKSTTGRTSDTASQKSAGKRRRSGERRR